jgi:cobalt-zinc-cadmium efflux system outer membrane protein
MPYKPGMNSRWIFTHRPVWTAMLLVVAVSAHAESISLDDALKAARLNPDMIMAREAVSAAQGDLLAADHAPIPVLSAKAGSMDLQNGIGGGNFFRDKRVDKSLGLDWTWERGGKREYRTEAARSALQASQSDRQEMLYQQLVSTAGAYYDLMASQERMQHMQDLANSAQELAKAAALRVKAGDLAAQDALRTDIEARRAEHDSSTARNEWRRNLSNLAQLTGRKDWLNNRAQVMLTGGWPSLESMGEMGAIDAAPPVQRIEAMVDIRSDVRSALDRLEAARHGLSLAQSQRTSDITWGASLDHYPGTSTRLLELRMQMPLQLGAVGGYAYQGEIKRAQAAINQAEAFYEKTRAAAMADSLQLWHEHHAAVRRAHNYVNEVLLKARQVADNAELAYRKGAISLTELIEARRTLRTTLIESSASRVDHAKSWFAWKLRVQPELE